MEKTANGSFDVYFYQRSPVYLTKSSLIQKRINDVDSLIITPRFGTMVYGQRLNSLTKMWYYLDASSDINIYGGWSDSLFRKDEIITIGTAFLDSVQTPQEVYTKLIEK